MQQQSCVACVLFVGCTDAWQGPQSCGTHELAVLAVPTQLRLVCVGLSCCCVACWPMSSAAWHVVVPGQAYGRILSVRVQRECR